MSFRYGTSLAVATQISILMPLHLNNRLLDDVFQRIWQHFLRDSIRLRTLHYWVKRQAHRSAPHYNHWSTILRKVSAPLSRKSVAAKFKFDHMIASTPYVYHRAIGRLLFTWSPCETVTPVPMVNIAPSMQQPNQLAIQLHMFRIFRTALPVARSFQILSSSKRTIRFLSHKRTGEVPNTAIVTPFNLASLSSDLWLMDFATQLRHSNVSWTKSAAVSISSLHT